MPFFSLVGLDLEAPQITCPAGQIVTTEPGEDYAEVGQKTFKPSVSDNSGNVTYEALLNSTYPVGEYDIEIVATDAANNQASCIAHLTVQQSATQGGSDGGTINTNTIVGIVVGVIVLLTVLLVIAGMVLIGVFTATLTSILVRDDAEEAERFRKNVLEQLERMQQKSISDAEDSS